MEFANRHSRHSFTRFAFFLIFTPARGVSELYIGMCWIEKAIVKALQSESVDGRKEFMKRNQALFAIVGMGLLAPTGALLAQAPDTLELTGVVRDFIERTKNGGHPDFERQPASGFGHYMGNVSTELDGDRKPVFVGGGHKVLSQWKNAAGQPILPALYDHSAGDTAGSLASGTDPGGIASAESFAQWYRDVPGLNLSQPMTLTLTRSGGTDEMPIYTYQNNAFFPIDNQLYGNSGGSPDHNFHFTVELRTKFTYKAGAGQVFSFYGDDDVWVYINGRLAIDIGGVHGKVNQVVELDRLGLADGQLCTLDFFFAERHRTQSNFRIDTTLQLESDTMPTVSALYD